MGHPARRITRDRPYQAPSILPKDAPRNCRMAGRS